MLSILSCGSLFIGGNSRSERPAVGRLPRVFFQEEEEEEEEEEEGEGQRGRGGSLLFSVAALERRVALLDDWTDRLRPPPPPSLLLLPSPSSSSSTRLLCVCWGEGVWMAGASRLVSHPVKPIFCLSSFFFSLFFASSYYQIVGIFGRFFLRRASFTEFCPSPVKILFYRRCCCHWFDFFAEKHSISVLSYLWNSPSQLEQVQPNSFDQSRRVRTGLASVGRIFFDFFFSLTVLLFLFVSVFH